MCLQCRRPQSDTRVRKICWRRDRLPTPVFLGFPGGSAGKESTYSAGGLGSIPGWEDALEKEKATHSSILAWRIPWTVQSMRSKRVGHVSGFHFHHYYIVITLLCSLSIPYVFHAQFLSRKFLFLTVKKYCIWDFPSGPVVKILSF